MKYHLLYDRIIIKIFEFIMFQIQSIFIKNVKGTLKAELSQFGSRLYAKIEQEAENVTQIVN